MQHKGLALKVIRTYHGIRQQDLAEYIGIAREDLSRYENGTISLNPEHIERIGDFFTERNIKPTLTVEFPIVAVAA